VTVDDVVYSRSREAIVMHVIVQVGDQFWNMNLYPARIQQQVGDQCTDSEESNNSRRGYPEASFLKTCNSSDIAEFQPEYA
jgi:hypothetical protein